VRMFSISPIKHLVLTLLLTCPAPIFASADRPLCGNVYGPRSVRLARVRVLVDEIGGSRETDDNGNFCLALSPEAQGRRALHLTFQLEGYLPANKMVRLPAKSSIKVRLLPFYTWSSLPEMPPALRLKLRSYR
jgi:hypothetical protein